MMPLTDHPEIAALDAERAALDARLAQAEARRDRAKRATAAPKPARADAERARDLIDGGMIPSAEPRAEITAAEAEIAILRNAIFDHTTRREELVSRLSFEVCQAAHAEHVAACRELDAAFGAVHSAMVKLHRIYGDIVAAGYNHRSDLLPCPIPVHAYRLGDPADSRSETFRFRTWLRAKFGEK